MDLLDLLWRWTGRLSLLAAAAGLTLALLCYLLLIFLRLFRRVRGVSPIGPEGVSAGSATTEPERQEDPDAEGVRRAREKALLEYGLRLSSLVQNLRAGWGGPPPGPFGVYLQRSGYVIRWGCYAKREDAQEVKEWLDEHLGDFYVPAIVPEGREDG
jgi:hypothetical protein